MTTIEDAFELFGGTTPISITTSPPPPIPPQLIDLSSCTYKSGSTSLEQQIISEVTVTPSSSTISQASAILSKQGFLIIKNAYSPTSLVSLSNAFLCDLSLLISNLKNSGIDLVDPSLSTSPPALQYREVALREDFRVDLKGTGPSVSSLPPHLHSLLSSNDFITSVIARTMSPEGQHRSGNYGRWNFSGGSEGPDAPTPPPISTGVGAVISLPGAGDQATHADAEHLFDHVDLPGHYYNLFASGIEPEDGMGFTCFVAGTHKLEVCERVMNSENREEFEERLCRPKLNLGDAIVFDARVLHFGAGNRSDKRRPVLYTNFWKKFYEDKKNWGGESIF